MPSGIPTMITHDGRTQSLADWARETGLNAETIRERLRKGVSPAKALTRQPMSHRARGRKGAKASPWRGTPP